MSETEKGESAARASAETPKVKIVPDIPVFFTDGVLSHSFAFGVSKFYFYRSDSDPYLAAPDQTVIVAQSVMSAAGFAKMVHFFNHRLKLMIEDGAISRELADNIAAFSYEDNDQS
jgi:hypothetical protein